MKTRFIKAASAALALLLSFSLVSCVSIYNKPKAPKTETDLSTEAPETEYVEPEFDYDLVENEFLKDIKRYLYFLGSADYGGSSFMIATTSADLFEKGYGGRSLEEMTAIRNRDVEKGFNVELYTKEADPDTMLAELGAACAADEFYADLIMIPQNRVYLFASAGVLMNMNSLPFSDYESGFNIESGTTAAMALSTGYALASWATLDPGCLPAVFFNKDLAAECGLEDPYALVRRGEWTWDEFFKYINAVASLNESRAAKGLSLLYSYGVEGASEYLADVVYFSEGNRLIESGLGKQPRVAVDPEGAAHTMITAKTLYNDPLKVLDTSASVGIFADGGSLFLIDRLSTMKTIRNSKASWGVLPMPKRDAAQESYLSVVPPDALMFAVPANSKGLEKTSRILSAININSLGYLVDEYLRDCMYDHLRDNDSLDSIEKICYGAVYDMAYTVGEADANIANSTYNAVRNVYQNNNDLTFYFDQYAYSANTALERLFS